MKMTPIDGYLGHRVFLAVHCTHDPPWGNAGPDGLSFGMSSPREGRVSVDVLRIPTCPGCPGRSRRWQAGVASPARL